jgi:hypothetical protein
MDTEALICNTQMVKNSFYIVQTIEIEEEIVKSLFNSSITYDNLNSIKLSDSPKWLKEFNNYNSVYKSLKVLENKKIDIGLLEKELEHNFFIKEQFSLKEKVCYEEVTYDLIFDYKSMIWTIVYHFPIYLKMDDFNTYIEVENLKCTNKCDFYNVIRDIFVKSNDQSKKSDWVLNVENELLNQVRHIVRSLYNIKIQDSDIYIKNNNGNITNVIEGQDLCENDYFKLRDLTIRLNQFAERINYRSKPIILDDDSVFYFNGRFHSIIIKTEQDRYRYVPLMYHMQFMWVYLALLYRIMENLNNQLLVEVSKKVISKQNDLIDSIIHKVQTVGIFNESFKRALESDNERIYSVIEKYWNIEKFLEGSEQYVSNFKDFLARRYQKMNEKSDTRQSNILYLISMLQMIALMSVWNDYMSIINESNIESVSMLLSIFGSVEKLQMFNFYLPIAFFGIIILFTGYGLFSRRY